MDLPDRSQIVKNVVFLDDDITEPYVVLKPGHVLFLTDGAVRICHWEWAVPTGRPLDLDQFLTQAVEEYPDRVLRGVAPDAPREPCPAAGTAAA